MSTTCDVVVLGMGTCGEDAALRLAKAGLDVVGIEANLIGGECPYWACLPTKSLIRSANLVAEARRANGLVGSVSVETDWGVVSERLRAEITGGWDDSGGVSRFEAKGGRFIRGWGRVVGPRRVEVEGIEVEARLGIIVATGSAPMVPAIPGLDEVDYWTNHDAVQAEELPKSLVILGGGAVGCELGQVFARFGVDVTIVEGGERLLAAEEPEAAGLVAAALAEDGITLRVGKHGVGVSSREGGVALELDDGSEVLAERLLLAVGRVANADAAGVGSAGAATDRGFVQVDELMRAAEGLWAIGDVTGQALLTHVAEYQGRIAVEDILGGDPTPADYSALPRATFTDPELGAVGLTESQARADGHNIDVVVKNLGSTFRGWLHGAGNRGVIKLIAQSGERRLLGATVVGPRAADLLGFLTLAIQHQIPLSDLVNTIYAFPTFYGGLGEAIGAYGRGIVRVLDPETPPLVDDPPPSR